MNCPKCFHSVASDAFICKCGWRRTITSVGHTSVLLPGYRSLYRWEDVTDGCLLVLEDIEVLESET
jgi:hypothetical protein